MSFLFLALLFTFALSQNYLSKHLLSEYTLRQITEMTPTTFSLRLLPLMSSLSKCQELKPFLYTLLALKLILLPYCPNSTVYFFQRWSYRSDSKMDPKYSIYCAMGNQTKRTRSCFSHLGKMLGFLGSCSCYVRKSKQYVNLVASSRRS